MKYNIMFISSDMPDDMLKVFSMQCKSLIRLEANPNLSKPVAKHPDMQILNIADKLVLTKQLKNNLKISITQICTAQNEHISAYPGDVILNCLLLDKYLLCNTRAVDSTIIDICREKEISVIHVNQGYTKCSTLVINNNAVITADKSIADTVEQLNYKCLLIDSGQIELDGYNYGFIGGASFYNHKNKTVYFFGDITKHSSFEQIQEFCFKNNTDIVSLSDEKLYDYGSIVAF